MRFLRSRSRLRDGVVTAAVLWRSEEAHVVEVGLGRLEAVDAQIGPRTLLDEAISLWPVEYGELRDVGFYLPPPEYFAAEESVDLTLVLCDAGLVLRSHRKFGPSGSQYIKASARTLTVATGSVLLP